MALPFTSNYRVKLEFDQTMVVNLRCVYGTCGGAWVGVVKARAGRGAGCGLLMLFGGTRAIPV